MATQVSENPDVESHYATQVALSAALLAALRRLWPTVEPLSVDYRRGVAALVEQFSLASISLSADYYEDVRDRAGVTEPYRIPIVDTPPASLVDAGLDWAERVKQEMDTDVARIQARVEAATQKAVMDVGRGQIVAAVEGDELALGFARVAKPDACFWCLSQAFRRNSEGRLGVYKSRSTAGQLPPNEAGEVNRYHNNCQCLVVPVFGSEFELSPHVAAAEDLYGRATEHSEPGELLNDFRRALDAERRGEELPTTTPLKPPDAPSGVEQLTALLGRIAG